MCGRNMTRERHWHLGPIGIHPDLQGQGVGSALLSAFLKTVDQQRSSAYLETDADRNVVLYQTFGFSVIGHAEINSVNKPLYVAASPGVRLLGTITCLTE